MEKYIPKGSMCAACKRRDNDCSKLDFAHMEVIESYYGGLRVVKCDNFERSSNGK